MKRILKYVILILIISLIGIITSNIYAATVTISASKTSAYVGDNVTINVSINAAAWNLNVSGSGINGSSITGFNMEGINQTTAKSYTLNTSSAGTYVISIKGDVSDGATDVTSDISQSVTVTVTTKPVTVTPPATITPSTNTSPSTNKPAASTNKTNTSTNKATNQHTTTTNLSSNAYLSEFRISEPGMTPSFNKTTYNYAVTVGDDVNELNVTAIPEDNKASVAVSGNTDLKQGDNTVTVTVTAQDKMTVNTYIITVTKADEPQKSNAYLQSLFVEDFKLAPEFSSEVFEYDLGEISEQVERLKISAFPVNENAKVDIVGNENLVAGENIVKVIVTSENGEMQKTYNLKVIKEGAEISRLVDLRDDGNNKMSGIWNVLKENATILLLYSLVWIEFLQVVYLYERLKKVENVDLMNKENVHEEAHVDKENGILKRIKIWKRNREE